MEKSRSSNLFLGKYMFHLHTTYTDGKLSIEEYFQFASESKVERLIFLEHIRQCPAYSVDQFVNSVRLLQSSYNIPAIIGFEAKLLPTGMLDICERDLHLAEVIGMAEHGFPDDFEVYSKSLYKVIDLYSQFCDFKAIVWVHPGAWLRKRGLLHSKRDWYEDTIQYAIEKGIYIEKNLRYDLLTEEMVDKVPDDKLVIGLDAHTKGDLNKL